MIEFLFVLYILMMFIFPLPVFSATLGAATCYLIFRKHYLWKHQPRRGRKLLMAYWTGSFLNFALSLVLAVAMALAVYYLIFKNYFLFVFNFLFCFAISYRWFDYAHLMFRVCVHKLKQLSGPVRATGTLVLLIGSRPHSGLGLGMMPSFLDAGWLTLEKNRVVFDGLLIQETWTPAHFAEVEAVSSEKIRLTPQPDRRHGRAGAYTLIVRDQFYPFRCRSQRDRIVQVLNPAPEKAPAPMPGPAAASWRSAG